MIKLNSSLQTKNLLGLSDDSLAVCEMGPYYNYLLTPGASIKLERAGAVVVLKSGVNLDVHKDYVAVVQPNPKLHEIGLVSSNTFMDKGEPVLVLKGFKAGEHIVDHLFSIRLLK
jgi:hypothetical protein